MLGTPEKIRLNLNFWLLAEHFCVFIIKKNISNRLSKVLISTSDVCKWKSEVLIIYNDLYKHLGFGPAKENIIWMHCWISNIQMRSAQMRISISNWILLTFCISCLWSRNPYIVFRIEEKTKKKLRGHMTLESIVNLEGLLASMIDTWRMGHPNQPGRSLQAGSMMLFHGGNFNRSSPHQVCKRFVNPSSLLSSYFSHLILFKVCVSIWRLVFLASHKLPPPVHSNFFSFLSFSINASLYVQSYKMPIYSHRAKASICDNIVTLTKQIWLKMKLCDNN